MAHKMRVGKGGWPRLSAIERTDSESTRVERMGGEKQKHHPDVCHLVVPPFSAPQGKTWNWNLRINGT